MRQVVATDILEANLGALAAASGEAVARVRAAAAVGGVEDVRFFEADDGALTGQIGEGAGARMLASRRRPLDEAARLVEGIDLKEAAVYVVAGFGMGYHVEALSKRLGKAGVIIVFEPDAGLLRAVLERVDCSGWIKAGNVCILMDAEDGAGMNDCLRGLEGLVGLGVTLVEHPASRPRLGGTTRRFHERFAGIVDSIKMTVITTLCQCRVTMRNLFQNADVYAASGGVADFAGACAGRAGIVVSAGPSLKRNVELLKDPAVRERCVIVAVQTVLKPLLQMGIRPHFVTALDYSEINRRFYEGLTAADVEGITLVVEPKVNPSVLMAWPGKVRCIGDSTLDLLLGAELSGRDAGERLKQGATVAHLAYYLARHLGCDPVALVGQDLGFTDGQYYAAGASIHNVWAGELNEFKSLELFEWQRIARMGNHLRAATDAMGRAMYTDSQMHSYLVQFESDFREDAAKGLTTIDATEGGVRKQHAAVMGLREFLDRHMREAWPSVDEVLSGGVRGGSKDGRAGRGLTESLRKRITMVRGQVARVAEISRRAGACLVEMREHSADRQRVDGLIEKVHRMAAEVEGITPGFGLTQLLGQATVFNRVRADRMIHLGADLDDLGRQKLQIQRDLENVLGLERTANELVGMLDGCVGVLNGGERITRDLPKSEVEVGEGLAAAPATRSAVVSAIVPVDVERSGLGRARRLDGEFAGRKSVLAMTVDRLLMCNEIRDVTLVAEDVEGVRGLLEARQVESGRVRIEREARGSDERRRRGIEVGRTWARECWRGGLGDLTIFDEAFDPAVCGRVLERVDADAALVVGPDWAGVDPELCARVIRRHREDTRVNRLTFSQAAPGLCGCVVSRELCRDLSKDAGSARLVFATIGGVLGYVPGAPLQDLIAHPICVNVPTMVRDCGERLVADSAWGRAVLGRALGEDHAAGAERIVEAARGAAGGRGVEEWVVDVSGFTAEAQRALREAGSADGAAVTVLAMSGGVDWTRCGDVVEGLVRDGHAVHVRVAAAGMSVEAVEGWMRAGVGVVSVDFGEGPEDAGAVTAMERLLEARRGVVGDKGLGAPWVVARMTRSDATWTMVEGFVERWVMACGWAAVDPLAEARAGERIGALPLPASAAARMGRIRRVP